MSFEETQKFLRELKPMEVEEESKTELTRALEAEAAATGGDLKHMIYVDIKKKKMEKQAAAAT